MGRAAGEEIAQGVESERPARVRGNRLYGRRQLQQAEVEMAGGGQERAGDLDAGAIVCEVKIKIGHGLSGIQQVVRTAYILRRRKLRVMHSYQGTDPEWRIRQKCARHT